MYSKEILKVIAIVASFHLNKIHVFSRDV